MHPTAHMSIAGPYLEMVEKEKEFGMEKWKSGRKKKKKRPNLVTERTRVSLCTACIPSRAQGLDKRWSRP
jgi:hypothetical protein